MKTIIFKIKSEEDYQSILKKWIETEKFLAKVSNQEHTEAINIKSTDNKTIITLDSSKL